MGFAQVGDEGQEDLVGIIYSPDVEMGKSEHPGFDDKYRRFVGEI